MPDFRRLGLRACAVAAAAVLVSCSDETVPPPDEIGAVLSSGPAAEPAARFLAQSTFGPTPVGVDLVQRFGYEQWLQAEFDKPSESHLTRLRQLDAAGVDVGADEARISWWRSAIWGRDQLRQRAAFALSQIMVVSDLDGDLRGRPFTLAQYMDVMLVNAFGNYRDLMEDVTYSPAMGIYLTYLQNRKGDMNSGRVPDENYAREIMQLFTIGLVELDAGGRPVLVGGEPLETYDNDDVSGLARVFTGLSWKGGDFFDPDERAPDYLYARMQMFPEQHSQLEKSFLGVTIPPNTPGEESIDIALDTLFNHPNTAPFVSRQLIQRMVTSNPSADYVQRVATAFESGSYTGPSGVVYGGGERGDLKAVWAAILLDTEARNSAVAADPTFGKIREPVIRFAHWARVFTAEPAVLPSDLENTNADNDLSQQAFRSPSVFNFYRPGYVAPGTLSGAQGLVAPELQITHETSVAGYISVMSDYAQGGRDDLVPDYSEELLLADDPQALVDHVDALLTGGTMLATTKQRIIDVVAEIEVSGGDQDRDREERVEAAVLMAVTSPEYLVQR